MKSLELSWQAFSTIRSFLGFVSRVIISYHRMKPCMLALVKHVQKLIDTKLVELQASISGTPRTAEILNWKNESLTVKHA